ncbi:MAG TPA: universal stress protein [Actinocrinis sp.]|nr:universal stress protein [Actinocrinis sp.]
MTGTPPAPIVVGVDGTAASIAALRWAAAEASAHDAPLTVVHVQDPRVDQRAHYAQYPVRYENVDDHLEEIEVLLGRTLKYQAERVFEVGVPSRVLVRHSAGARMLVLGHTDHNHPGHEGDMVHEGPVLGAIARACVAHAVCAVVVVPVPAQQPAPKAEAPGSRHVPEPAGARALHPRVRATTTVRD